MVMMRKVMMNIMILTIVVVPSCFSNTAAVKLVKCGRLHGKRSLEFVTLRRC